MIKIVKHSLLYRFISKLISYYEHSEFNKLDLFFKKAYLNSKTKKVVSSYINSVPRCEKAALSNRFLNKFSGFFTRFADYNKNSLTFKLFHTINSSIIKKPIESFLVSATALLVGINTLLFIKEIPSNLFNALFIIFIITYLVFIKVQKYYINSFICKIYNKLKDVELWKKV